MESENKYRMGGMPGVPEKAVPGSVQVVGSRNRAILSEMQEDG